MASKPQTFLLAHDRLVFFKGSSHISDPCRKKQCMHVLTMEEVEDLGGVLLQKNNQQQGVDLQFPLQSVLFPIR